MREDEQVTASSTNDAKAKMLSGSAWMTAGSITSRIWGNLHYSVDDVVGGVQYPSQCPLPKISIFTTWPDHCYGRIPSAISNWSPYNGIDEYGESTALWSGICFNGNGDCLRDRDAVWANLLNNGDANVTRSFSLWPGPF